MPNANDVAEFGPAQVRSGVYTVRYNAVPGYYTPSAQRVVLNSGDNVSLQGRYVRVLLLAFTGWNNAPNASDCATVEMQDPGSGVTYDETHMNQEGLGIGRLVLSMTGSTDLGILGTPALQPGLHAAVFTFYSGKNGNACTAPFANLTHAEAAAWLFGQEPSPDDIVVVLGHSYGGHRAYLFANQVQRDFGRSTTYLATIDAVDWQYCNTEALILNQPFGVCDQTDLVEDESSAQSITSFYQVQGERRFGYTFPLKGYSVPGATRVQKTDYHTAIDDNSTVHRNIRTTILNLVRGPQVAAVAGTPSRNQTTLTVPIGISVTGFGTATVVSLTAISLNGVPATNLASIPKFNSLPAGTKSPLVDVSFNGSAAVSGTTAVLTVSGTFSYGQTFASQLRIRIP